MELPGQTDVFAALGTPPPVPPFTVHTCIWADMGCGWCGATSLFAGGGAQPRGQHETLYYSYCQKCYKLHGSPRVTAADFPLVIDRTQKDRPADAPDLLRRGN